MKHAIKAQVVFPADLLDEIDEIAGARKRSDFLVEAARMRVAQVRFERALALAAGSWSAEDHPETRSQTALTRWLRRARSATQARLQRPKGA